MKTKMLFMCLLLTIANLHGMGDTPDDDPSDRKITALMNEIELVTAEVTKLRVQTISLETSIRSHLKGFENFKLLGKIPTRINPHARQIKADAVTAQLATAHMPDAQKAIYKEAVLHLFDLEHEGMILEHYRDEMRTIIEKHQKESSPIGASVSLWCLLL